MYRDLNMYYVDHNSPDYVQDAQSVIQSLSNLLKLRKTDVVFGHHIGYDNFVSRLFDLIEDNKDLQLIKFRQKLHELKELEPRVVIDIDGSSLSFDEDNHKMSLTIKFRLLVSGPYDSHVFHEVFDYD